MNFQIQIKTWMLFGLFIGSLLLHAIPFSPVSESNTLPSIPALTKDDIRKIVLTYPQESIVFEKQDGIWNITSPIQQKADYARLRAMFLQFRKEIPMDMLVDQGRDSDYGLDANSMISIELWSVKTQNGDVPTIGFSLGHDAEGGTSYLHLHHDASSTSKNVYRAKVGTRARYDFSIEDWQNQILLDVSPIEIAQMDIQNSEGEYVITRDQEDKFTILNATFSIDSTRLAQKIVSLGQLRIGKRFFVQGESSVEKQPIFGQILLTYRSEDGIEPRTPQLLRVYKIEDQQAFVSLRNMENNSDTELSYIVAASLLEEFFKPTDTFRNKKIFSESKKIQKEAIDRISFVSKYGNEAIELQQDLSNGFWTVLQPSQKSIDMRKIFFMVNTLVELEAVGIVENPLEEQRNIQKDSLILHMLGGTSMSLQFSDAIFMAEQQEMNSRQFRFVHIDNKIFVISEQDYVIITEGFGISKK